MFSNYVVYRSSNSDNFEHFNINLIFEISNYIEESIEFILNYLSENFVVGEFVVQQSETVQKLMDNDKYVVTAHFIQNGKIIDYNDSFFMRPINFIMTKIREMIINYFSPSERLDIPH